MRQHHRDDHVDDDQDAAQAREQADDDEHRPRHFTQIDEIGEEIGKMVRRNHVADRADAGQDFVGAVKQQQHAQCQPQHQLAQIFRIHERPHAN
jgi:hypothetical protein